MIRRAAKKLSEAIKSVLNTLRDDSGSLRGSAQLLVNAAVGLRLFWPYLSPMLKFAMALLGMSLRRKIGNKFDTFAKAVTHGVESVRARVGRRSVEVAMREVTEEIHRNIVLANWPRMSLAPSSYQLLSCDIQEANSQDLAISQGWAHKAAKASTPIMLLRARQSKASREVEGKEPEKVACYVSSSSKSSGLKRGALFIMSSVSEAFLKETAAAAAHLSETLPRGLLGPHSWPCHRASPLQGTSSQEGGRLWGQHPEGVHPPGPGPANA